MKTLAQAMTTDLHKISSQANVFDASRQMRDRLVGSLVVVRRGTLMRDQEEEIIGLITEADIIRKAVADERDLRATSVDMVMTSPMITVEASWPIEDAFSMMKDSGVRHLLVTKNQIVVGLVSIRDLLVEIQDV